MGNKCQKERRPSKIFLSAQNSRLSNSVTVPSVCTSPSYHLSVKKSTSSTSSEAFNWNQMQHLYLQQEFLTVDHLSVPILKVTSTVLEVLKRHMGVICGDMHDGTLKFPDQVVDKFQNPDLSKTQTSQQACNPITTKKAIVHFVNLLYVHDIIIDYFRLGKIDEALDLIKQIAVSHALNGVTPTEFRMMDWFIIHFLIKNKITSDESINYLMIYLNTVSNYISKYYVTQSVRYKMIQNITTVKKNDRNNKARENFRLMKKWKQQIVSFKGQETYVEQLLNEQIQLRQIDEDVKSIDTVTLKENDFIMKHFIKKKQQEGGLETIEGSNKSASTGVVLNDKMLYATRFWEIGLLIASCSFKILATLVYTGPSI